MDANGSVHGCTTAAAQALQLVASLRASEAFLMNKLAAREQEHCKLTRQSEQARLQLQKEQTEVAGLRAKVMALEAQVHELRAWQGSPGSFESDVAAAIQHAKAADTRRDEELLQLRRQMETLRGDSSYAAVNPKIVVKSEKLRYVAEITKLGTQLKSATGELERCRKDLFSERVRSKRAVREHDDARAQLKSARDEMGRVYDELARMRQETARLTAMVSRSGPGRGSGPDGAGTGTGGAATAGAAQEFGSTQHRFHHGVLAALTANETGMGSAAVAAAAPAADCGGAGPNDVAADCSGVQSWAAQAADSWGRAGSNGVADDRATGSSSDGGDCGDDGGLVPKYVERRASSVRSHGPTHLLTPTADPALLSALLLIQTHQQAMALAHTFDGATIASEGRGPAAASSCCTGTGTGTSTSTSTSTSAGAGAGTGTGNGVPSSSCSAGGHGHDHAYSSCMPLRRAMTPSGGRRMSNTDRVVSSATRAGFVGGSPRRSQSTMWYGPPSGLGDAGGELLPPSISAKSSFASARLARPSTRG